MGGIPMDASHPKQIDRAVPVWGWDGRSLASRNWFANSSNRWLSSISSKDLQRLP
jgi:hypothetical protein